MAQPASTTRVAARITPENLKVIQRAAEILGRSVSDFVVTAAKEAAERTIEQTQVIRLSVEDSMVFVEAILNPPPLTPSMTRAIARHKARISSVP